MSHPLDGAKAKIERAIHHINKLENDSHAFERSAYTTLVEHDLQTGTVRFIAKDMGLGDPPVQLMLLASEIAYQLRSSLDHVAFILAKQARERDRQFPIFDSPDKYKAKAPTMIKGASLVAEAIIESVQPYHRGATAHQDPLWMLQSINNADKHRLIPASLAYAKQIKVDMGPGGHSYITLEVSDRVPKDGTVLCTLSGPTVPDPHVDVKTQSFCVVAFAQIADTKYEPIIPFFTQAITYVDGIIERFRSEV